MKGWCGICRREGIKDVTPASARAGREDGKAARQLRTKCKNKALLKKKASPPTGKLPKGVYLIKNFYQVHLFFFHFGIIVRRILSVTAARTHLKALLAVKPLVRARLNKLVMAGASVALGDFVRAVKAGFMEARKLVDISAWSYFSRIEKKGLATVTRSNMCSSLDAALNGWCGICTREEIEDVTPLENMESKRAAG